METEVTVVGPFGPLLVNEFVMMAEGTDDDATVGVDVEKISVFVVKGLDGLGELVGNRDGLLVLPEVVANDRLPEDVLVGFEHEYTTNLGGFVPPQESWLVIGQEVLHS